MWIKNITPGRNEIIQPKTVVFSEPDAATFKAARLPFWVEIPRVMYMTRPSASH
jgi:hypothetical protein